MKKIIIILVAFLAVPSISNAQTWKDILQTFVSIAEKSTVSYKNITTTTVEVNSASKWGGDTRKLVDVRLPAGTKGWYYRITPFYVSQSYQYASNETLHYLITNNVKTYACPSFGTYCITDNYVFTHSADKTNFDNKNSFGSLPGYKHTGVGTGVYSCDKVQDLLWIGIKNPNNTKGLKVIVEVVAWGYYN